MPFDFKKEYKEFYLSPAKPQIVRIPEMNYVAVRGRGNPNEKGGEYQKAIKTLYAVSYIVKMSKKTDHAMNGYFRLCHSSARGLLVAGGHLRHRLFP